MSKCEGATRCQPTESFAEHLNRISSNSSTSSSCTSSPVGSPDSSSERASIPKVLAQVALLQLHYEFNGSLKGTKLLEYRNKMEKEFKKELAEIGELICFNIYNGSIIIEFGIKLKTRELREQEREEELREIKRKLHEILEKKLTTIDHPSGIKGGYLKMKKETVEMKGWEVKAELEFGDGEDLLNASQKDTLKEEIQAKVDEYFAAPDTTVGEVFIKLVDAENRTVLLSRDTIKDGASFEVSDVDGNPVKVTMKATPQPNNSN